MKILTDNKDRFYSGVIEDIKDKNINELDYILRKEYEEAIKLIN